jgi:hypothetical protein
MDDKKIVNTQHVKYIEKLSSAQNSSLLNPDEGSIDDTVNGTGLASAIADNRPVDGASSPLQHKWQPIL